MSCPQGLKWHNFFFFFKKQSWKDKKNLKWRIFTHTKRKIHIVFAKWFGNNLTVVFPWRYLPAYSQWTEKKMSESTLMQEKSGYFQGLSWSTVVIEDSLRAYSFSFGSENSENKFFLFSLHDTKIHTQLPSKIVWWLQLTALCLVL